MNKIGKTQSFSREYNNLLVLRLLQKHSLAATEMSEKLSLSNATLSSIVKKLTETGIIKVSGVYSNVGVGRKRVNYELNVNFGLVLCVNISNFHAVVSISNIKQEIIKSVNVKIDKYNSEAIYLIILEATKLLYDDTLKDIPLKQIVISLPGRVNSKTGELALSRQFEKELFSESNFIMNAFKKQFRDVPVTIANDINLSAIAELKRGCLENIDNACYISVDYGIGGAFIINKKLYDGEFGFAGEVGLIKCYDGERYGCLDDFVSLRAIADKAVPEIEATKRHIEGIFDLYIKDEKVKTLVLNTIPMFAEGIKSIIDVFDVSRFVISGRVRKFGDDYLNKLRSACSIGIYTPTIEYSILDDRAEIWGATYVGVENILNDVVKGVDDEK